MLWLVVFILTVLWLLGLLTSYTMGGVIHLVLAVAIVIVLINIYRGGRVLGGRKPN